MDVTFTKRPLDWYDERPMVPDSPSLTSGMSPGLFAQWTMPPGSVFKISLGISSRDVKERTVKRAMEEGSFLVIVHPGFETSVTQGAPPPYPVTTGLLTRVIGMEITTSKDAPPRQTLQITVSGLREVVVESSVNDPDPLFVWRDILGHEQELRTPSALPKWATGMSWTGTRPVPGQAQVISVTSGSWARSLLGVWDSERLFLLLPADRRIRQMEEGRSDILSGEIPIYAALCRVLDLGGRRGMEKLRAIAEGPPKDDRPPCTLSYICRRWVVITGARSRTGGGYDYQCASLPEDGPYGGGIPHDGVEDAIPGTLTTSVVAPGELMTVSLEWDIDFRSALGAYQATRLLLLVQPSRNALGQIEASLVEVIRRSEVSPRTFTVRGITRVIVTGLLQIHPYTVYAFVESQVDADLDASSDSPARRLDKYTKKLEKPASPLEELQLEASNTALSSDARGAVFRALDRAAALGSGSIERASQMTRVRQILDLPWGDLAPPLPSIAEFRNTLDHSHFGMDTVKKRLVEHVVTDRWTRDHESAEAQLPRRTLLMVGPPGTGKTSMAESLANALGRSFGIFPLASITQTEDIFGSRAYWVGSVMGGIARAIRDSHSRHMVLCLDEVDKIVRTRGGDVANALLSILDPDHSHNFRDSYLDVDIDISGVIFVLTANSLASVHPAILDRTDVVEILPYTDDEKRHIARQFLIPKAFHDVSVTMEQAEITDDAIDELISSHGEEEGVRKLSTAVRRTLDNVVLALANGAAKVIVDKESVTSFLGESSFVARDAIDMLQHDLRHSTTISPQIRDLIQKQFEQARTGDTPGSLATHLAWARVLLEIPWIEEAPPLPDLDQFRDALQSSHYGMVDAKKRLVEHIVTDRWALDHRGDNSPTPRRTLLLVGPPGTGKTSLAAAMAQALGRPFQSVPLASLTYPQDLLGTRKSWVGASMGAIARAVHDAHSRHLVMCLDEVDKIMKFRNGDVSHVLLSLLDPDHSATFMDDYIDTPMDISGVTFIMTANALASVHPAILDRTEIVEVEGYTVDDKMHIAKEYLLPRAASSAHLDLATLSVSDDAFLELINNHGEEEGVRHLMTAIRRVVDNAILELSGGRTHVNVDKDSVTQFLGASSYVAHDEVDELEHRLRHAKDISERMRSAIERELTTARDANQGVDRAQTLSWVRTLLDLPWGPVEDAPLLELSKVRPALDATHAGMKPIKKAIVDRATSIVWSRTVSPDTPPPTLRNLLLIGPPGTGKSTIIASIASALGRPFQIVPCGSFSDAQGLGGSERLYISSRPGAIVDAIRATGTTRLLLGLDEIDKMGSNDRNGDPYSVLMQLTDPVQNIAFVDRWLTFPLDVSAMFIVATANDLGSIPSALRDRFEILEVRGYSPSEKVEIARDHILPMVRNELSITEKDVVLTDDAIDLLVSTYALESGVRALNSFCRTLLVRAAATILETPTTSRPLAVDRIAAKGYLGASHAPIHAPLRGPVGYVPVLAVIPSIGQGRVGSLMVRHTPGATKMEVTGLLEQDFQETIQVAMTYVLMRAHEEGIDLTHWETGRLHITTDELWIHKSGPSAGIAAVAAFLSLARGQEVVANTVVTGAITLDGRVEPIGGVGEKVVAAHRLGATTVILPAANADDIDDIPDDVRGQITIHLAARVDDALAILLPLPEPVMASNSHTPNV